MRTVRTFLAINCVKQVWVFFPIVKGVKASFDGLYRSPDITLLLILEIDAIVEGRS